MPTKEWIATVTMIPYFFLLMICSVIGIVEFLISLGHSKFILLHFSLFGSGVDEEYNKITKWYNENAF